MGMFLICLFGYWRDVVLCFLVIVMVWIGEGYLYEIIVVFGVFFVDGDVLVVVEMFIICGFDVYIV